MDDNQTTPNSENENTTKTPLAVETPVAAAPQRLNRNRLNDSELAEFLVKYPVDNFVPRLGTQLNSKIKLSISNLGEPFFYEVATSAVKVSRQNLAADCELVSSPEVVKSIISGDTNPQYALLTGQVKITGDLSKAIYFFNLYR